MTFNEKERRASLAFEQRSDRKDAQLARRLRSTGLERLWLVVAFGLLMLGTVGGGLVLIVIGVQQNSILLMGLGIAVTAGGPGVVGAWLRPDGA